MVEKELLVTMRKAGFVRMSYGIESGDTSILRVLQKGETIGQIEYAIKITKEAGIITRGSIIIGSPHETKETVKRTFKFIRHLKGLDQVVINVLQPYPGTKVRDMIINGDGDGRDAQGRVPVEWRRIPRPVAHIGSSLRGRRRLPHDVRPQERRALGGREQRLLGQSGADRYGSGSNLDGV